MTVAHSFLMSLYRKCVHLAIITKTGGCNAQILRKNCKILVGIKYGLKKALQVPKTSTITPCP
jgi:hypothetical protein